MADELEQAAQQALSEADQEPQAEPAEEQETPSAPGPAPKTAQPPQPQEEQQSPPPQEWNADSLPAPERNRYELGRLLDDRLGGRWRRSDLNGLRDLGLRGRRWRLLLNNDGRWRQVCLLRRLPNTEQVPCGDAQRDQDDNDENVFHD